MPRSYEQVLAKFKEGWSWDRVNAAKFKLIEFLKWEDVPEDYQKAIIARYIADRKKLIDKENEGQEVKKEISEEELLAEALREVPNLWNIENEYPLQIPPIITDIYMELKVAENLKYDKYQAAMFRLHRIYALVWLLADYPLKKLEKLIKEGAFNRARNQIKKLLSPYKRVGEVINNIDEIIGEDPDSEKDEEETEKE